MATESLLSAELLEEIKAVAVSERKSPEELVREALREYKDNQGWQSLLRRGAARAAELGLTERDVDRLITEQRQQDATGR